MIPLRDSIIPFSSPSFTLSLLSLFAFQPRGNGIRRIYCSDYDGVVYTNHTKCPSSPACCEYDATCLSNRLCTHVSGDGAEYLVRETCAYETWDADCAIICLYSK